MVLTDYETARRDEILAAEKYNPMVDLPTGYLRYLQIQALENTKAQLIYVPTDSGLPVTEAGRLRETPEAQQ